MQVVVLAAGYDTRAYRLKTGDTQVSSNSSPSWLFVELTVPLKGLVMPAWWSFAGL